MWSALYPSAVGVVCQARVARSTVAGLALIKLTRLRQHAGRAVAPSAHGPRGRGASPPIIRICAGGASFYAGGRGRTLLWAAHDFEPRLLLQSQEQDLVHVFHEDDLQVALDRLGDLAQVLAVRHR